MADVTQINNQVLEADKTLDDLKNEFTAILEIVPNLSIRDLKKYDSHFDKSVGVYDFHNAKRGQTSYDKIKKILSAARKHIAEKQSTEINPETIRTRQRLISAE